MIFTTKNFSVRKFILSDLDDLIELHADEGIYEFELAHPLEKAEVEDYLKEEMINYNYEDSYKYDYAIIHTKINKLIGTISIQFNDANRFICQIGCWINSKFIDNGIGTEVCHALLNYLFKNDVKKVSASTFFKNEKSCKVLEKIGMKKEGHIRMGVHVKGEYLDEVYYGVLYSEFDIF